MLDDSSIMETMQAIANLLPPEFILQSYTQIASLWSNYGHVYRLHLTLSKSPRSRPRTLILKSVHPPSPSDTDESHIRKLLSYEVERWFYHHYASRIPAEVKIAKAYTTTADNDENLLLEDLSTDYMFPARGSLGKEATLAVVKWLAGFHGTFFGVHRKENVKLVPAPNHWKKEAVEGVWKRGLYWYLETRREEHAWMDVDQHALLVPWVEKVRTSAIRPWHTHSSLYLLRYR